MSERVLVTGATGFVGSHLVPALSTAGYDVIPHSSADGDIAHCPLPFHGVTRVFHLAARSFVPDSWTQTRAFYETNVLGAVNVLEFCRRTGASLCLMSSYVYGRPRQLPIDEDHPVEAFNPYAQTKLLAEQAAAFYATQFGIAAAIIRPFNIYGPGQNPDFLIPMLVRQVVGSDDTISVADPRPRRDFLHVRDLVRLLLAAAERRACGVYNAGSGSSVSVAELADAIQTAAGTRKPFVSRGEVRENEVLDTVANSLKATRELGWTPEISLEAGLRELVRRQMADRT